MGKIEQITDIIEDMIENEPASAVAAWNNYCGEVSNEDEVFPMDEFDEICEWMKPWEVARAAFYGDFCPVHDYFRFNVYGNLESFDGYELKSYIYTDDMADYAISNNYDFGIPAIRDILEDNDIEEAG